ncbi:hypothetical protein O0L34_g16869 [Tuta absoluta]|nr:hypothetical protein O0L34_g16869 [Tuta absoluta]
MARWKLSRLAFGNEEYTFLEDDEVTLGRGINNTISLSSIVVSRNHCVINVKADKVLITDLKSSNGIYVGLKKIPPNVPFSLDDSDIIGIGWTKGAPVANIKDHEKYMFKLTKEKPPPITSRLTFQSDEEIESDVVIINELKPSNNATLSPILNTKQTPRKISSDQNKSAAGGNSPEKNAKTAKRKLIDNTHFQKVEVKLEGNKHKVDENVITILSDSENEASPIQETISKKPKIEPMDLPSTTDINDAEIKTEREDCEYDAFKVKQEYLDDEPIQIDSESDDESVQWLMRLSQSSPGKSLTKVARESAVASVEHEESSYSQIDDFEDVDDPISILPQPPEDSRQKHSSDSGIGDKSSEQKMDVEDEEEFLDDLISLNRPDESSPKKNEVQVDAVDGNHKNQLNITEPFSYTTLDVRSQFNKTQEFQSEGKDEVDGGKEYLLKILEGDTTPAPETRNKNKTAQIIEALAKPSHSRTTSLLTSSKYKNSSTTSKHSKGKHKKHSSSRRHITDSQKEERKKKLKDIANKEKEEGKRISSSTSTSKDKSVVNAKVTCTNRGAFLTDVVQGVVKPMKRKESPSKSEKNKEKNDKNSTDLPVVKESGDYVKSRNSIADKPSKDANHKEPIHDIENKKKQSEKHNSSKHKEKDKSSKERRSSKTIEKDESAKAKPINSKTRPPSTEVRIPLKSLKPLSESEDSFSGKPFSKVEPMPTITTKNKKPKKSVRFSLEPPKVHVFEIEEGNNMKKTSLVKTSLVDARQAPVFSLEKITLMRILRWNPQWLEEQINNNEPPPILGTNNHPMAIFHSFSNHSQYIQVVGDLLLMEIWECLSQGYMRVRNQAKSVEMRIASLPPISSQDRCFELFNLSVNVSVPNSEIRTVPRSGEIILVTFGAENCRNRRFFYVHNVRTLPSPPNNRNSFFCISLHACYTDKMKYLKPGELMIGVTLSYIQKELMLFEAMEHLAGSPLSEAILKPEARHFVKCDPSASLLPTQWTNHLNASQKTAVFSSVTAALGDRPSIQMVQGPPGTGKSSVICSMVLTYFYDTNGKRLQNRGKILICATSNAAVDELVIRLLSIRQDLPKMERFRMVRVGRAEAMHPRAHDISSQQLAQREAAAVRRNAEPNQPGLDEEISHLQAKVNMWRTQEQDAKDPVRAAYCKSRVKVLCDRITLLQSGGNGVSAGGGQMSAEQLLNMERKIIEGADIVVTTLSSAQNHKMRCLRRRIALCIIDEAGQAIEPETLIPLTLDVTRLALIGDPQQLPGFICSQRAKKHGLGESLFYRLTSCAEQWGDASPVVLLNQQYRMHTDIADYPNRAFYNSRILSLPPARPSLEIPPYSIVSISSGDKGQGSSGANEMEAWGVARLVLALDALLKPLKLSLAVITPYNAHKDLIKRNLRLLQDLNEAPIEVNTVDSFQGQERDVVVVSLARSQGVGFLQDTGRMNVMLTRAKHALCVCLNPHAMLKNYQWRTLVEDAQKRNHYRILPHKICQGTAAGQIPNNEVLKYIRTPPHK